MKIFSALRGERQLTRNEAWGCALINQFATPGLGTLMARRWIAATGQLVLAFGGFGIYLKWFIYTMRRFYSLMFETNLPPDTGGRWGKLALVLFGVAWAWALVSSIQIVRNAPESTPPPSIPPRIV